MATPVPPRLPAGERLHRAGIASWSIIGLLLLTAISLWLLLKIRVIFPPLVVALLIIYLLNPLVTRLQQRRIPRVWGVLLSYVVVLGSLTLLMVALVPFVTKQVAEFGDHWPEYRAEIVDFIDDTAASIEDRFNASIDTTQISCLLGADETATAGAPTAERCDEVTKDFRERIASSAGRLTEIGGTILEVLLIFILGPLLALYLLIDLPALQQDLLALVPENHRDEAADLGSKIGRAVGGFFRGQLLVALIVGVMTSVGFRIIGLPFWLVIGGIAGFTNLIPLIGPFIGGGIGLLVGLISEGVGLGVGAAVVALIVQQIDNHVISPNVMRRTMQLHPVTVMLSLLAGGALAGFWGLFLGVPTVAVAKILLGHLWATRVLGTPPSPHAGSAAVTTPPSVAPEEAK